MVTRGSRSGANGLERPGLSDNDIRELITTYVTLVVMEAILMVFKNVKTTLIDMFDESYVAITKAISATATATIVVVGLRGGRSTGSSATRSTQCLTGTRTLFFMRWIIDVNGFFMCVHVYRTRI